MKVPFRAAAPLAAGFALLFAGPAMADGGGAVYTQTNSPTGNAVHRLDRGPDGSLTPVATYRTGGLGTGSTLQSQGAVALSDDGRVLVAVDAGTNDIASFRVSRRGHLTLIDRQPSGGNTPVSVDVAGSSAYVLNRDGIANVTGFDLDGSGRLRARATTALTAGAAGAAQVSVAPDGRDLVVTERGSNRIETLPLRFGRIGAPVVTASSGAVPFGFAFSPRGDLIVSEAGASTVSSYRLNGNGSLRPITAALAVGQGAACWVVVDRRRALRLHRQRVRQHLRLRRRPRRQPHGAHPGRRDRRRAAPERPRRRRQPPVRRQPRLGRGHRVPPAHRRPPRRRPGRRQPRHRPRRTRRSLSPATAGRMTCSCTPSPRGIASGLP